VSFCSGVLLVLGMVGRKRKRLLVLFLAIEARLSLFVKYVETAWVCTCDDDVLKAKWVINEVRAVDE